MSSLEKFNHNYHIYERSKPNKEVYRCIHPDCTHYTAKAMLLGKRSECPKCKDLFILTRLKLKNKLPTCDACSKSPKAAELREAKKIVEGLDLTNNINDIALPEDIRSILE